MRNLLVLFLIAALASTASALTMEIVYISGETDDDQPADVVTNVFLFDTEGVQWLSADIIVQPGTTGAIFQSEFGSEQSASDVWRGMAGELNYDTYVSNGVHGVNVSTVYPADIGGTEKIWTEDQLAMGWYTDETDDIGTNMELLQITLDDDLTVAKGAWQIEVTAGDPEDPDTILITNGFIEDGEMHIPEPATMGLLAIGGFGLLIRRKR